MDTVIHWFQVLEDFDTTTSVAAIGGVGVLLSLATSAVRWLTTKTARVPTLQGGWVRGVATLLSVGASVIIAWVTKQWDAVALIERVVVMSAVATAAAEHAKIVQKKPVVQ